MTTTLEHVAPATTSNPRLPHDFYNKTILRVLHSTPVFTRATAILRIIKILFSKSPFPRRHAGKSLAPRKNAARKPLVWASPTRVGKFAKKKRCAANSIQRNCTNRDKSATACHYLDEFFSRGALAKPQPHGLKADCNARPNPASFSRETLAKFAYFAGARIPSRTNPRGNPLPPQRPPFAFSSTIRNLVS